jgi:hypothetical protein
MPVTGSALLIGLDVHNDSIAMSLAPSDTTELRHHGIVGGAWCGRGRFHFHFIWRCPL